jgi:hypothetical protein
MNDIESKYFVAELVALRGRGCLDDVILKVESNLNILHEDYKVLALREAFLSAVQLGDEVKSNELANQIGTLDPLMPSIQSFLNK